MKRSQISPEERTWRSQVARLVSHEVFLRANLEVRERVCGKPNCHCARGEKHASLYAVRTREGTRQQLFVPRAQEEEVRLWVSNYQRLLKLLERISDTAWNRVGKRET